MKKGHLFLIPVVLLLLLVSVFGIQSATNDKQVLTAIVETTEIDVSAKIPGRLETVTVREGDMVKKGQVIATLQSNEIDAKVEQARGATSAAKANLDMAHNGARPEELVAVEKLYMQAKYQFEHAEKTFERVENVYQDSVISKQERDEVEFKYNAAREQMEAALAKYEMVKKGARPEKVRAAEGLYHQAQNALAEAESYQNETMIKSPVDGQVQSKVVDPGEMVSAGYPIVTLIDTKDVWLVFHLKEDQLKNVHLKDTVYARFPALGEKSYACTVSFIAPMADFATWRATSQKGEFDLKTFEIHLRPVEAIEHLRPGMTAHVELKK